MSRNRHNDEQIMAFANEMLEFVDQQKEEMFRKIEEFHEPNCTAPQGEKEKCMLGFSVHFLDLLSHLAYEKELEKLHGKH